MVNKPQIEVYSQRAPSQPLSTAMPIWLPLYTNADIPMNVPALAWKTSFLWPI
jgi:hypothetical protein